MRTGGHKRRRVKGWAKRDGDDNNHGGQKGGVFSKEHAVGYDNLAHADDNIDDEY